MDINITETLDVVLPWLKNHIAIIVLILIGTWILSKFMNTIIVKIVRRAIPGGSFASHEEEEKRENTLIKISQNFFGIFVWVAAFFGILYYIGVPVAPLITSAGIVGIAVGFGSQALVRDIITGLFIIAENQFRIGDFISIGEYSGTVEDMTLRVTKLRENDGTIHYIPNGEIKVASNKSKDFSMVDFKIGVGYNTDIDKLEAIINKVGEELAHDPEFGVFVIEPPHFLRVDGFLDSSINIHVLGKVFPKKQYLINGEMRRRLKKMFDEESIEIPYPKQIVYNSEK